MNSSETSQRFKTDLLHSSDSDDDKNNSGEDEHNIEDYE
jgi:hypothetical protein